MRYSCGPEGQLPGAAHTPSPASRSLSRPCRMPLRCPGRKGAGYPRRNSIAAIIAKGIITAAEPFKPLPLPRVSPAQPSSPRASTIIPAGMNYAAGTTGRTGMPPSARHLQPPPFESSVQPVRTRANASRASPNNTKSLFFTGLSLAEGGAAHEIRVSRAARSRLAASSGTLLSLHRKRNYHSRKTYDLTGINVHSRNKRYNPLSKTRL